MQDKEFDDLFHSKLDNFEMEPSAQVWTNIDAELNGKKRKSIFPLLNIAASIIILVIAGVLFIPQKPKDDGTKPDKTKLANNLPAAPPVKLQTAPVKNAPEIKVIKPESSAPENMIAAVHHTTKTIAPAKSIVQAPPVIKTEPIKADEQQMIAAVIEPKTIEIIQHSVPDAETTPLTIKQPAIDATPVTHDAPEVTTKPVLASTQLSAAKPNKVKKHGIRNFGDLVNLVVAKVDKRKDKVIQFTDTDDDGSTLTGVHVGAINIKKDNK